MPIPLFLISLISAAGLGFLTVISPDLFFSTNHEFHIQNKLLQDTLFSISLASTALFGLFGKTILGGCADHFPRHKVLLLSTFGVVIGYLFTFLSIYLGNPYIFILSRMIAGFFDGVFTVIKSYLALLFTEPEKRIESFRLIELSNLLGTVLGPALILSSQLFKINLSNYLDYNNRLVLILLTIFSFLNAIWVYKWASANKLESTKNSATKLWQQIRGSIHLLSDPKFRVINLNYTIFQFACANLFQSVPIILAAYYSYNSIHIGYFSFFLSICMILNSIIIYPILLRKFNLDKLFTTNLKIIICIFIIAAITLIFSTGSMSSLMGVLICLLFYLLYTLFSLPRILFLNKFSELANKNEQGLVMAMVGQIASCAYFISGLYIVFVARHHAVLLFSINACLCMLVVIIHSGKSYFKASVKKLTF